MTTTIAQTTTENVQKTAESTSLFSIFNIMIAVGVLIVISIIMFLIFTKGKLGFVFLATTMVLFVILSGLIALYCTAKDHGAENANKTPVDMINSIKLSPKEDKLPEDLSGCIIIYYRFGCKDCEAIYPDLAEETKNMKNVYFVSSRSEQGKSLINKYPVDEVPAGIYIRKDSYNGNLNFTAKILYQTDDNKITFNETNWERLKYLQSENK